MPTSRDVDDSCGCTRHLRIAVPEQAHVGYWPFALVSLSSLFCNIEICQQLSNSCILSVKPLNFVHTRNKEMLCFTNKNIGHMAVGLHSSTSMAFSLGRPNEKDRDIGVGGSLLCVLSAGGSVVYESSKGVAPEPTNK